MGRSDQGSETEKGLGSNCTEKPEESADRETADQAEGAFASFPDGSAKDFFRVERNHSKLLAEIFEEGKWGKGLFFVRTLRVEIASRFWFGPFR